MRSCLLQMFRGLLNLAVEYPLVSFIPGPQNTAEWLSTFGLPLSIPFSLALPSSGMHSGTLKLGSLMLNPHLLLFGDPFKEALVTWHPDVPLFSVPMCLVSQDNGSV